ncbi:hypothetical protein [Enterovibrio nigricans]|uniref:Solute:sodium symporter small subunit n=1 Tax=Enterovibrio nigricans DSM 22720 TaxID=1121868 RepID=A0A1T4V6I3_9GAMM|nr:hypothetical protein [Enterovibrio nigricans]PKF50103.1 hypothetical protein AT251_13925 [Enterovibrio nigricans]SKA60527.1 hypothetical protein SAMN02745132_03311 [Enterovibrio nigricans DSM 22720]
MKNMKWLLRQAYELGIYYVIAVCILLLFSESMNIALRFWSEGRMSFWGNGLWQLHFFTAMPIALYVYIDGVIGTPTRD